MSRRLEPVPVRLSVVADGGPKPGPRGATPGKGSLRARRPRWVVLGTIALLIVVLGLVARELRPGHGPDVRDGTTLVTAQGLAAKYGIKVKLIAVTAAGGLVDFRYQVVDPDKASPIIHEPRLFPKLIAEDTGATLSLSRPAHSHRAELELGGTYFFLLANARSAIHTGSPVTLVIGDARVEHLVAR